MRTSAVTTMSTNETQLTYSARRWGTSCRDARRIASVACAATVAACLGGSLLTESAPAQYRVPTSTAWPEFPPPPLTRDARASYAFETPRHPGGTTVHRRGMLGFDRDEPRWTWRYTCLGHAQGARLRTLRRSTQSLDRIVYGRQYLIAPPASQTLNIRTPRGPRWVIAHGHSDERLPPPARRLIRKLTRMRERLWSMAERSPGGPYTSRALCGDEGKGASR